MSIHDFFLLHIAVDVDDTSPALLKKLGQAAENYFYLGGKKAKILKKEANRIDIELYTPEKKLPFYEKALKIGSYCTLIVPTVMFVAKLIFRGCNQFSLQRGKNELVEEPSPIAIETKEKQRWWQAALSQEHLQKKRHFCILTEVESISTQFETTMKNFASRYRNKEAQKSSPDLSPIYRNKEAQKSSPDLSPMMGHVNWVPGNFSFHMEGVALIASYLSERRGISGLFSCKTLEAFSTKLHEIATSPTDSRFAFVVPAMPSHLGMYVGNQEDYPQHKISVCVEKKDGQLQIAILNSDPCKKEIDPTHITGKSSLWENFGEENAFTSEELILRAITKALKKTDCKAAVNVLDVQREHGFGCAIFGLLDSVTFLEDKEFFSRIVTSQKTQIMDDLLTLTTIEALPPDYMVGTQSITTLNKYKKNHPDLALQKMVRKEKTLDEELKKNVATENGKLQNHYIMWKLYKYSHLALEAMQRLSEEELQKKIRKNLLS